MTGTAHAKRSLSGRMKIKFLRSLASGFPYNRVRVWALRCIGFSIGKNVYIGPELGLSTMNSDASCQLLIGNRVSIGPRVMLILASDPNNSRLAKIFPPVRGTIRIEEDVWLGANVTILPNVTIGKCSVIAAGSVVTKDVSPYTVVAGVPAVKIRDLDPGSLL